MMIKSVFLASLAAVALAAPEADPQYPLGLAYGGLPLAYSGVLAAAGAVPHVPVVKSVEVTPAEVTSEVTAHAIPIAVGYHGLGHFGYGAGLGGHYLGKRSADAEADPLILAGGTKVLTAPTPFIHNPPLVHHAVAPLVAHAPLVGAYAGAYGLHGAYSGYGLPGHYLGKRSADADPLVLAGSTQVLTAPTPFIHNPPLIHHAVAPLVAHAPLAGAYGYGLPFGHYIGKREAEADAQYPLAYAGLPLPYTGAFASAGAVPHVPVVKSVEVTPAEVSSEVHAHAVPVAVGYHGLGHFGHFGYHG